MLSEKFSLSLRNGLESLLLYQEPYDITIILDRCLVCLFMTDYFGTRWLLQYRTRVQVHLTFRSQSREAIEAHML